MDTLISTVAGNTAVALGLALIALLAARFRRPALAHVVWLLVIMKLLTPPLWRLAVIDDRTPRTVAPAAIVVPAVAPQRHAPAAAPMTVTANPISKPTPPVRHDIPWLTVFVITWVTGSVAWLALVISRIVRFRRALGRPTDDRWDLAREVQELSSLMGIHHPPVVRLTDAPLSPMLLFLGRGAQLILPISLIESLDAQQRRAVIAHELAHLRRGDHWVRLFELLATAALWWHPLLWLARLGLREAEEQCCDAWVVSVLPEARRRYADALVDAMEFVSRWTVPACASGFGRLSNLRRRFTMIVTATAPKSLSLLGKLAVAALLIALPLSPVRGQNKNKDAAPATKPIAVDDSTRKALEALMETALDPNPQVQQAGMNAIFRFGKQAVPVLIDALGREKTAHAAEAMLAGMGEDAVAALMQSAQASDPATRERALGALEGVIMNVCNQEGYRQNGFPTAMFGAPGAADGMEGGGAAIALNGMYASSGSVRIGVPPKVVELAKRVRPVAANALTDSAAPVRRAAAKLIGLIAYLAPDASITQSLIPALKDEDAQVRQQTAQVFASLGALAADAVDALAGAVNDPDKSVRLSALNSLAGMGVNAKGAMGTVAKALKDGDPDVRMAAANALGAMQPPPTPPPGTPVGPEGAAPLGGVPPAVTPAPTPDQIH